MVMLDDVTDTFELTQLHIDMLQHANWGKVGGYPAVRGGRPFGNSDPYNDALMIMGIDRYCIPEDNVERFNTELTRYDLFEHHEEFHEIIGDVISTLPKALAVILQTQAFEPGMYKQIDYYYWEKA